MIGSPRGFHDYLFLMLTVKTGAYGSRFHSLTSECADGFGSWQSSCIILTDCGNRTEGSEAL